MNFSFYSSNPPLPKLIRFINKILKRLEIAFELVPTPVLGKDFITREQSINIYHLLNQVIFYKVPGEIVELGSHIGQSALIIQSIIETMDDERTLIVFDKFDMTVYGKPDKEIFISNFKKSGFRVPEIHQGAIEKTVPHHLPQTIAFLHIDLGTGINNREIQKLITHCLKSVYPHLSPGAVCLIMDYHDPQTTIGGNDENPGIIKACDEFFKNKPEKIFVLYGNQYSHGYFHKNIPTEKSLPVEKPVPKRAAELARTKS